MRPYWRLTDWKHPSLHPSIDAEDAGERCHFWLIKGTAKWARDYDEVRRRRYDQR
ncbi:MAG: DUF6527 family protein [Nitrososphaerales archaeon]